MQLWLWLLKMNSIRNPEALQCMTSLPHHVSCLIWVQLHASYFKFLTPSHVHTSNSSIKKKEFVWDVFHASGDLIRLLQIPFIAPKGNVQLSKLLLQPHFDSDKQKSKAGEFRLSASRSQPLQRLLCCRTEPLPWNMH